MKTSRHAFTLPELLLVIGIFGSVLAGASTFFLSSYRALFVSTEKLKINRDIRTFTSAMMDHARDANKFLIYPSFAEADRNEASDRQWMGRSGDLLVLVFHRPFPGAGDPEHITRIVGYLRSPDADNVGPVRRFDLRWTPATYPRADLVPVESLLPAASEVATFPQVIELSRGLADQHLFYNLEDRAIVVKGEILHGNAAKRVTDTYNFTVSPRN